MDYRTAADKLSQVLASAHDKRQQAVTDDFEVYARAIADGAKSVGYDIKGKAVKVDTTPGGGFVVHLTFLVQR